MPGTRARAAIIILIDLAILVTVVLLRRPAAQDGGDMAVQSPISYEHVAIASRIRAPTQHLSTAFCAFRCACRECS